MSLTDVRRLTGANFLMDKPGAAAEAVLADAAKPLALSLWRNKIRRLLDAVGWQDEVIVVRA